jgi:hypothetical protein
VLVTTSAEHNAKWSLTMLYVLATLNFTCSLFFPDSGIAGLNVGLGFFFLGAAIAKTTGEVVEAVRVIRKKESW